MEKTAIFLCACAASGLCAAGGQIPQKMRDLWENPVTEARIETGWANSTSTSTSPSMI